MEKVWVVPEQFRLLPEKTGTTLICATTGFTVALAAVKALMFPEPDAAKPILVVLLVQLYCVPVPLKDTKVVEAPLQTTWLAGAATMGVGFTVNVNVTGFPGQATLLLVKTGVTVTVDVEGIELLELMAVNIPMFPVPDAASPIDVLLFVQL